MMLYPFLAVIFDALTLIITKKIFVRFKALDSRSFAWWLFVWISLIGLMLSPWLVVINPAALEPYYLWLLVALVFLAANLNLLYYYSLEYEKVCEIEPFLLFNPIVAIVVASFFYADERSWHVYVAAAVAGAVLAWAHLNHRHLKLNRPLLAILGFSVLYAIEVVILKKLLTVYSPLSLYIIRAAMTALFLWIINKGKITKINIKEVPYFILLALGAIVTSWLVYTSYHGVGIGMTMAVLLLSPILVYLLSIIYLKEKLKPKDLIASIVIVGVIIWLAIVR